MRRATVLVSSAISTAPKCINQLLLEQSHLFQRSSFGLTFTSKTPVRFFSSAKIDEEKLNNKEDPKGEAALKFTLKKGNSRMTSAEFFSTIKKAVGENLADDKLVIPRSAYDAIAGEYDEVCAEVAAFKDKYTRALAETENVRRRGVKQVEETKLFHLQKFSKDLIGVRDILDLAVQSVKKEDIDGDPKLKAFHEGIVMTCEVFEKTFRTHGIERLSPLGEKFNPNLHEAVFQVPKDKAKNKPGYVEEVMTIGYALHGRPIRAAKVAVVAE